MSVKNAPLILILTAALGIAFVIFGGRAMLTRHDPWVSRRPAVTREKATNELKEVASDVLATKQKFAFDLMAQLKKSEKGNFCVSPLAIDQCLAMLLNGAQGDTFETCAKVMGLSDPNIERLNKANSNILDVVNSIEGHPVIVSNALWSVVPMKFNKDYSEDIDRYYDADVRKLGSARQNALSQVNDWCKDRTGGKITNVFDHLDATSRLILLSLVTLDAQWAEPFESVAIGAFQTPTKTVQTPMMSAPGLDGKLGTAPGIKIAGIPYRNEGLTMWVVLSDDGKLPDFGVGKWRKALSSAHSARMDFTMPKLSLKSKCDLRGAVSALGGAPLFRGNNDFTFMSHDAGDELFLSQIIQTTLVTVDEKGTRIQSASEVESAKSDDTPTVVPFHVDKPFVFLVTESASGSILFMGAVKDPTEH